MPIELELLEFLGKLEVSRQDCLTTRRTCQLVDLAKNLVHLMLEILLNGFKSKFQKPNAIGEPLRSLPVSTIFHNIVGYLKDKTPDSCTWNEKLKTFLVILDLSQCFHGMLATSYSGMC